MDNLTPEQRAKTMTAVKSKGTKLEKFFIAALERRGIGGLNYHRADIEGKPDVVHEPSRIAIFIDSCFWHGCPEHLRMPASNEEYWTKKIARNKKRDRRVRTLLEAEGWKVIRIWEHSIRSQRNLRWWLTRIENLIISRAP